MEPEIDPPLVAAFGSETRVRVLAVLAWASRPMTAYRVGKTGDVPLPKAYNEIYRLEKAGLVGRRRSGWVLLDDDIRALLRRRVRILWLDDWVSERSRRATGENALLERLSRIRHPPPPRDWKPKDPQRFARSRLKDRVLREMGLRTSIHAE
ncbi:MAG: hypothetical protein WA549_02730 [Thermoplasmata archaeon]